jgi:hypothetical protein
MQKIGEKKKIEEEKSWKSEKNLKRKLETKWIEAWSYKVKLVKKYMELSK